MRRQVPLDSCVFFWGSLPHGPVNLMTERIGVWVRGYTPASLQTGNNSERVSLHNTVLKMWLGNKLFSKHCFHMKYFHYSGYVTVYSSLAFKVIFFPAHFQVISILPLSPRHRMRPPKDPLGPVQRLSPEIRLFRPALISAELQNRYSQTFPK